MTLEEIRILAACPGLNKPGCESCDAHTTSDDGRCWGCAVEMEAPTLAALLVRAVEALRPFAYPVPHDWYAIVGRNEHGHPLNTEGVQRQSARSLLRELGVEA